MALVAVAILLSAVATGCGAASSGGPSDNGGQTVDPAELASVLFHEELVATLASTDEIAVERRVMVGVSTHGWERTKTLVAGTAVFEDLANELEKAQSTGAVAQAIPEVRIVFLSGGIESYSVEYSPVDRRLVDAKLRAGGKVGVLFLSARAAELLD